MIRKLPLMLFLLFFPFIIYPSLGKPISAKGSIRGLILDAKSGVPIPGVSVILAGIHRGTNSDSVGAFAINNLMVGKYSLSVSHIGYEPKTIDTIQIKKESETVSLEIRLERKLLSIKGITVTPSFFSVMGTEPTARQSLTRQEMETVPQVGDDFFRAISRLPGMGSNDFSARMTVRGGEFDEVLVNLDGLQLYEPFHQKDVDGGALSIIDVAAMDGIDILTGGFPANYGDRMSAIFNIHSRRVEPGQQKFSAGLSLLNAKVLGEGSFNDNKGSWLVSARRGYIDYAMSLIGEEYNLEPTYYDLYGKVDYRWNHDCALALNFLHAGDKLKYKGIDEYDSDSLKSRYGNSYGWISLNLALSRKLTMNTIISTGKVKNDRQWIVIMPSLQIYDYTVGDINALRFLGYQTDLELSLSENYLIEMGFDFKRLWSDYDYLHKEYHYVRNIYGIIYLDGIDSTRIILEKSGSQIGAYLSNRIRLANNLTSELGFRYDYTSYAGDELISPRVNAVYDLGGRTSIRAGWGYFYQSEGINEINIGSGETDFYPAEKVEHRVIGLQHAFKNGINFRLEFYSKIYSNPRPESRSPAYNIHPFPEYTYYWAIYYRAKSYSRGIELYLKKDMTNKFSWQFSYAYAIAEDSLAYIYFPNRNITVDEGVILPTPYDQRHTIYFDMAYRPESNWMLNIAWHYHTGRPYTEYEGVATSGHIDWVDMGQLRTRYRPFSRVDLRINRYFRIGKGQLTAFIELINAFDRENVRGYNYIAIYTDGDYISRKDPEYWLGIIPSFGLAYQVNF